MVVAEKSRLQFIGGSFRRVVELVRISLRFRSSTGKLKELRIKCVVNPDGSLREKNLPLAMVLCPSDGGWQGAVQNCFQSKFGLSPELQKLCFAVDHQAYSYEETTADSSTIPGIPTVYKTHSTAINVKTTSKASVGWNFLRHCTVCTGELHKGCRVVKFSFFFFKGGVSFEAWKKFACQYTLGKV